MLQANNVTYSHKSHEILKGIDLHLDYGEVLAIVGPNGAGKSSLLNILANEVSLPKQNKVLFQEKNFSSWNTVELAHYKAKFSQANSHDIPLLAKDVVLMGRYPYFNSTPSKSDWSIVHSLMEEFGIFHLKEKEYNRLSGGEKQRVHLARAFVQLKNEKQTKLLFLDEPLNNLDVGNQHKALKMVKQFTTDSNSAIVVLHDLNLASRFADKVLLMKKGKGIAYGKPEEVFLQGVISDAYDFPCAVCKHPITNEPMIVFGE